MDHAVFDPKCQACIVAKKTRVQRRATKRSAAPVSAGPPAPEKFGLKATCDTLTFSKATDPEVWWSGDPTDDGPVTCGLCLYDFGSDARDYYPLKHKD